MKKIIPFIILLMLSSTSNACFYFDVNFDRSLFEETEREAFMFRDPEAVNLILKTSLKGIFPDKLAWVFPLPSKPISYKETDSALFDELRSAFFQNVLGGGMPTSREGPTDSERSKNIKVHEKVIVGSYEIIPIEILQVSGAGEELNSWLRKQKFIELPTRVQKPYLKKGSFFLAIRLKPKGQNLSLKPLWVRYKSDVMSFPLRFTHDDRRFDFTLYYLGPSAKTRGVDGSEVQNMCVRTHALKENDLINWMPLLRETTKKIKDGTMLKRIVFRGINKNIQTAKLIEDPTFLESETDSMCQ